MRAAPTTPTATPCRRAPRRGQKKPPMEVDNESSAGGGDGEEGGGTTAPPRGSLPCPKLCFAVCLLQRADGDALQLRWQALRQGECAADDIVVVELFAPC